MARSILILYSDTGGGHRAAAQALERSLQNLEPATQVNLVDPLIGEGKGLVKALARLYSPIIRHSRQAWGVIYHTTNSSISLRTLLAILGGQVEIRVETAILKFHPDLVVSVHPLLNHVSFQAIRNLGLSIPLATVVTDLVGVHRSWINESSDLVIVPTDIAAQACRRRVPPTRLKTLGMPIDPRFGPPGNEDKLLTLPALGLNLKLPTLLILGGGDGAGPLVRQVLALSGQTHPWQIIAVCGRNSKAQKRLEMWESKVPLAVLGFVDNMPELMKASDLVISKAGPGAIAEALATQRAMILTGYLPGQESDNIDFVVSRGFGLYEPHVRGLIEAVTSMLADNSRRLKQMQAAATATGQSHASSKIARALLDLASVRE